MRATPSDRPRPLRILIETSVLLTYLASRNRRRTAVHQLLASASLGMVTLLWAEPIADEAIRKAAQKSLLREVIGDDRMRNVLTILQNLADPIPTQFGPYPLVCRDANDDYVVAHARAGYADIVVTLDRDLLALGDYAGVLFVKPGAALALLRAEGFNLD